MIDEVQRVPAVLNEVHRAIEATRRRFVLLGSSARRLTIASTNLLAGRAALRTMFPLQPDDMGADFDLDRALTHGTIPVVWQAAFESRLRARERKHPKLYWVDPGLVRAAKRQPGPLALQERGPLFEGVVLTLLHAHNASGELYDDIAYWSPAQGGATEVDVVPRRGRQHLAVEVKHQNRMGPDLMMGLRAIADLPRLTRRVVVYRGRQVLRTEDRIDVWPFDRFVEAVAQGTIWP